MNRIHRSRANYSDMIGRASPEGQMNIGLNSMYYPNQTAYWSRPLPHWRFWGKGKYKDMILLTHFYQSRNHHGVWRSKINKFVFESWERSGAWNLGISASCIRVLR